jgi:hypothetical protein
MSFFLNSTGLSTFGAPITGSIMIKAANSKNRYGNRQQLSLQPDPLIDTRDADNDASNTLIKRVGFLPGKVRRRFIVLGTDESISLDRKYLYHRYVVGLSL